MECSVLLINMKKARIIIILFCCFTVIDDCVSMPCANNGTCIDGVDEVTCICTGQFTGQYCETCVPYNRKNIHIVHCLNIDKNNFSLVM
jgi:hypothetical protein